MAFTIEPGIYIRQSALDALPRTPENIAFIEKVQPAVRKYADIGVRIEDSFLLEESGLTRLSGAVPRTIDDIEAFLRRRTAPATRIAEVHRFKGFKVRGSTVLLRRVARPAAARARQPRSPDAQLSLEGHRPARASSIWSGSVHLLTKDYYPLSPALDTAFKDSDLLVEEVDLGETGGARLADAAAHARHAARRPVARQGRVAGDLRARHQARRRSRHADRAAEALQALDARD